ncbi:MAG: Rieske 2Fe-2S domain-containing protein [Bacteroidetes bacterium]|nr:Rieske 2Fe-2S domain-containing protein [Bacteroidota bacterium]
MNRRNFIKSTCLTCVSSVGAIWLLQACKSTKHVSNFQYNQNIITIQKTEFITVKNEKTIQRKFIVIKPDSLPFPIAVYKLNDNDYKTSLLQCSHQGCELSPYETTMVCPCHGAEFNTKGEVTQGPAETNLKTFITTYDNDNIYIQIN